MTKIRKAIRRWIHMRTCELCRVDPCFVCGGPNLDFLDFGERLHTAAQCPWCARGERY